ncbi:MAG TPA: hypothetical protein ENF34_02405 [Candidatus Bathyarchaeota archaeon]|nr:hypothetical protein [Candidatus Bathyarchaeota archaeon]
MSTRVAVPERLREKFINDVLDMYARGEVSAARAASMLGIPLAQFYELVAEKGTPMPDVLNESLLRELRAIARGESREEERRSS